jgi:hypothetical protein
MTLKHTLRQFEALFAKDKLSPKFDAEMENAGEMTLTALRAANDRPKEHEIAEALIMLERYNRLRDERGL